MLFHTNGSTNTIKQMLSKVVAKNIKVRRTAMGHSRESLGGCHAKVLARLESGSANPTLSTLEKVAQHLNLKVSELFHAEAEAIPLPMPKPLTKKQKRILQATEKLGATELQFLLKMAKYLEEKR